MRKQKKYHYIYKTTNLKNGKFYVGMHSTDNLNDGYLGSGVRLKRSIRRNGIENFKIEYLEFFKNRNDLTNRESQLVNEDLLKDKMCMNLRTGGSGGFCNDIHKNKFHAAGGKSVMKLLGKRHNERMITDLEYRKKVILKLKNNKSFLGKTHKEESKKKIGLSNSIKQKGENNSQFGTCWITNGIENKKIKKTDIIPNGWEYGRKLKKVLKVFD